MTTKIPSIKVEIGKIVKCECPEEGSVLPEKERFYGEEEKAGMNHQPNECRGNNAIRKYIRNDKEIYLCSCCHLLGDELI